MTVTTAWHHRDIARVATAASCVRRPRAHTTKQGIGEREDRGELTKKQRERSEQRGMRASTVAASAPRENSGEDWEKKLGSQLKK